MRERILFVAIAVLLLAGTAVGAQEEKTIDDMIEQVAMSCKTEIESYCSQVSPGEGRLLACFYAHQDKLSGQCEYALYDASAALEQFAAAVTYVATECNDDIHKFCANVEMGEGRVGLCLLDHKAEVSKACSTAMDDVELVAIDD